MVCAFLNETRQEGRNKSYELLVVLASRTRDRILEGRDVCFTALNLKEGVAPSAAKEPSGWISPLWTKLIAAEPEWQEGMADVARRRDLGYLPRLVKEPGSPAHYRLEAVPLTESAHPDTPAPVPPGGVHYTPQAVAAPAAWFSSTLRSGVVRWTRWLRWVFAGGVVVLTLLAAAGIALTFTVGIRATRPPNLADLISLLTLAGLVAVVLPIYRFFDDLFDLRIVMAPEALTPISQGSSVGGSTTTYLYNGLEQRVSKTGSLVPTGAAYYAYDEEGKTIGEYDANLYPVAETIYLGATPVAVLKETGTAATATLQISVGNVYADQTDTPRVITRSSDEAILWRWDGSEAFGNSAPNENPSGLGGYTYNQRMPGQVFDAESQGFYNLRRDYQARTGRYVQSDPMGIGGGINTYAYVSSNPLQFADPSGLVSRPCKCPPTRMNARFSA